MSTKQTKKKSEPQAVSIEAGRSLPDVDSIPIARMTPAQLHRYAKYYNWDGGTGPMRRVIGHPKCDLGTALMIFWHCDPRYYYECISKGDTASAHEGEGWHLMGEVIAKVRRGHFKTARLAFDPRKDMGCDWTAGPPSLKAIGFPEIMCAPVRPGRRDERIGGPKKRA